MSTKYTALRIVGTDIFARVIILYPLNLHRTQPSCLREAEIQKLNIQRFGFDRNVRRRLNNVNVSIAATAQAIAWAKFSETERRICDGDQFLLVHAFIYSYNAKCVSLAQPASQKKTPIPRVAP